MYLYIFRGDEISRLLLRNEHSMPGTISRNKPSAKVISHFALLAQLSIRVSLAKPYSNLRVAIIIRPGLNFMPCRLVFYGEASDLPSMVLALPISCLQPCVSRLVSLLSFFLTSSMPCIIKSVLKKPYELSNHSGNPYSSKLSSKVTVDSRVSNCLFDRKSL
jgi:hypothetical protein